MAHSNLGVTWREGPKQRKMKKMRMKNRKKEKKNMESSEKNGKVYVIGVRSVEGSIEAEIKRERI